MSSYVDPTPEMIIDAVNQTQRETGMGCDALAGDEKGSALVREKLPKEFENYSTTKLMAKAVNLRKQGALEKTSGQRGQRSYPELEQEGARQQGETRATAASVYRWTNTEEFARTVGDPVKRRDRFCQFCGSTHILQCHHRSYKNANRGTPELEQADCIALCKTCHTGLHQVWRKRKTGKPSPLQMELDDLYDEDKED